MHTHSLTLTLTLTLTQTKWQEKEKKEPTFIAPANPPNAATLAASSALPPLGSWWLNVPSGCRDGDGILQGDVNAGCFFTSWYIYF